VSFSDSWLDVDDDNDANVCCRWGNETDSEKVFNELK
jgi:hypothetical protein